MHKSLLFGVLFLSFIASSQLDEVKRITETLCSEEFHGRGYTRSGDSLAAEFIAKEFKKVGAEPRGDSYFQEFSFSVNTFPGNMLVEADEKILIPDVHFIADPSSPSYSGTLKPGLITVQDLLDEEQLTKVVRGIIADPALNAILIDLTDVGQDTLKELNGVEQAFSAVLPVIRITDSKFNWSVGREQFRNPVIMIQDSIYQGQTTFRVDIEADFVEEHVARNVIAYIPSRKKCRKTIVFTAHYDHLGEMGEGVYFPGANDNASGTAMLISMARYFKENPVDYNVMFIAFAGEEAGLLGSKHYTEHPFQRLKKIRFLINLDIMGSGEEGITVVNATLFEREFNKLKELNQADSLLQQIKSRGPAANSDHYWFTEKGVPAFFIYTMGPNKHYHDIFDTYDELTFNEYDDIVRLLTGFVTSID